MHLSLSEFRNAARPFDPILLEDEFQPLVEEWKSARGDKEVASTRKHFDDLVKRLRRRAKPPIAIDEEGTAQDERYKDMVEYAKAATAIGEDVNCGTTVLHYLQELAFGPNWQKDGVDFNNDVRTGILEGKKARPRQSPTDDSAKKNIIAQAETRLQKKPTFGYRITKARQDADVYYQTDEFRRKIAKALEQIAAIPGHEFSWDLEGTLVSTSIEYMKEKYGVSGVRVNRHMLRPGANELLAAFADPANNNGNSIWTAVVGQSKEYGNNGTFLIENCGLVIPANVPVFFREDTVARLQGNEEIAAYFSTHQTEDDRILEGDIKNGQVKFPNHFPGVIQPGKTIDDKADYHSAASQQVLGINQSDKFMRAPAFHIPDEAALSRHHKDDGLFEVVRMLYNTYKPQ